MLSRILTCALIVIGTGQASLAQDVPQLMVLPSSPVIRRDLGGNGYFTCRPADGDEQLIDELVWVDPQNQEIPSEHNSGDDEPRISTSTYVQGQQRELYINKVLQQDSGKYTCKARYATNQEITRSFELVVYMSIRWDDAPEEQNPITGSEAKIKCVVRASPVAVVEWLKNGAAITSGGRYVVEQDGLVIKNITSDDDGTYICQAKVPSEGELDQRNIHVEVHSRPEILKPQPNTVVEVTEKEAASIPCQTTGKPVPTRTWVNPDNADVSNIPGLSVDPKDGTLNFDPATRDMGGEYKCIAQNDVGRQEMSVQVIVIVKPEIVRYENVTVNEQQTAVLECKASGSPLPQIQFRKLSNEQRFEDGTAAGDERITVAQHEQDGYKVGTLTITQLRRSDDGLYECVASNKGGEHLKNGHITTQFSPDFTNSPMREIYSWNHNLVNLTCVAESIPNATITWEFKRRLLEIDVDSNMERIGNGPTSVLQVLPTDSTYYGTFTCKASNILGTNELDIVLFEATVPSALTDVQFKEVTATTITFTMNGPASDGGLPLVAYAVQYKKAGQSWDARLEQLWPVGTAYVLDKLKPEKTFVFRFAAKNDVGVSEWSAEQQMVTPKIDVPEPPILMLPESAVRPADDESAVVNSVQPDSYTVQWRAGANNGEKIDTFEIAYYEVALTESGWRSLSDKRRSVVDFPGTHTFTLSQLKPQTHYRVQVRAHNKIGFGRSAELVILTAPGTGGQTSAATTTTATATVSTTAAAAIASHLDEGTPTVTPSGDRSTSRGPPAVASSVVVGVAIGVLIVLLLLIDLTCYATNSRGLIHMLCSRTGHRSGPAKLTEVDSEKEPLQESKNGGAAAPAAGGNSDVTKVVVEGAAVEAKDSSV